MIKYKAMRLVKTLRSGTYKQGRDILVDENDCFCVMGVVCNESETDLEWRRGVGGVWYIDGQCYLLPGKIQKEYGFYNESGERSDGEPVEIKGVGYESLMDANDNGVSFEDLADYIEKNYKVL